MLLAEFRPIHEGLVLRRQGEDGSQLRSFDNGRIQLARLEMDTFLLLITHCTQADLSLLELAVHHLILGAGGGTQDLDSGYWSNGFEGAMLLEALVLFVVRLCPFLRVLNEA